MNKERKRERERVLASKRDERGEREREWEKRKERDKVRVGERGEREGGVLQQCIGPTRKWISIEKTNIFFPKQNKSYPPPVIIFEKNNFSLNSVLDVESIGELEEWNSNEAEPEAWAAAEDGLGEKIYFQATKSGSIREWIIVAWVDLDLSSVALLMSCYFAVVGSNGGCHKETYRGQLSA